MLRKWHDVRDTRRRSAPIPTLLMIVQDGGHARHAPGADSEEKREPVSDIDIAVADSLKVFDLKRPIREATDTNLATSTPVPGFRPFACDPACPYRRGAAPASRGGEH